MNFRFQAKSNPTFKIWYLNNTLERLIYINVVFSNKDAGMAQGISMIEEVL